jgi:hypothetical protein
MTYSDDDRINAIFEAAEIRSLCAEDQAYGDRLLSDAIDAAMSHADLEGYRRCKREVEQAALEKAARAMNETGQGEHGGLVSAIENIWGLPPRRVA